MNKHLFWNRQLFWRIFFYAAGTIVLALGITLNTKSGLGVSPIISMPFAISQITGWSFGVLTFLVYSLLVVIEFLLKGKNRQWQDILQVPYAFVFSLFLSIFSDNIHIQLDVLWQNVILLGIAIFATGAGMALMVNMDLVPNPGDGLAQAIGDFIGKDMGLGKNILDLSCVAITTIIGLAFSHKLVAIGIGTVLAMLLTGRAVAVVNFLFKKKMQQLAGTDAVQQ